MRKISGRGHITICYFCEELTGLPMLPDTNADTISNAKPLSLKTHEELESAAGDSAHDSSHFEPAADVASHDEQFPDPFRQLAAKREATAIGAFPGHDLGDSRRSRFGNGIHGGRGSLLLLEGITDPTPQRGS